jgi:hypothetical protein
MTTQTFCGHKEATRITGLSQEELNDHRRSGRLKQGIHWTAMNSRNFKYNVQLLLDWMTNQHAPELHETAIQNFLASLPSSQPPVKSSLKSSSRAQRTAA